MKKPILGTVLFLVLGSTAQAQTTADFFSKADRFLTTYVKEGRVDYGHIKNDVSALDEILTMARTISVSTDNAPEYQAFWINGYNLLVIKGIVDNYPLKSPLNVPGFFDKITYEIGGVKTTLNDIENKLLRAKFPNEPRFHFVLVCAGLGCPPIIDSAYRPETLNGQMQIQTEKALNDPDFIRLNKNKVKVSQIFEWYKGDFTRNGQSLVEFINTFRKEPLPEKAKVSFYPYDWTLNGTK